MTVLRILDFLKSILPPGSEVEITIQGKETEDDPSEKEDEELSGKEEETPNQDLYYYLHHSCPFYGRRLFLRRFL